MTAGVESLCAWPGARPDPNLLFTVVRLVDGDCALAWNDGTSGYLTSRQVEKFRPVSAGMAMYHGAEDRRLVDGLPGEHLAQMVERMSRVAAAVFPGELYRWWRRGFFGGGPS